MGLHLAAHVGLIRIASLSGYVCEIERSFLSGVKRVKECLFVARIGLQVALGLSGPGFDATLDLPGAATDC